MPCRVAISLEDGRRFEVEKRDYEGFHSRPMSWDSVVRKFHDLAAPRAMPDQRSAIARAVSHDNMRVRELTALLAQIREARLASGPFGHSSQCALDEAALAGFDRDSRPLLLGDGAALSRGPPRHDAPLCRWAEIRRRVLRVDAAGQSRRDHRSRPPPRRLCLDRRVDRERAALWCRGGRKIPRGSEDSRLRRDRTLDRFHYDSRRRSAAADTAGGKKLGSRPSRSLGSSSVPAVVRRRSRSWRQRARATLGG